MLFTQILTKWSAETLKVRSNTIIGQDITVSQSKIYGYSDSMTNTQYNLNIVATLNTDQGGNILSQLNTYPLTLMELIYFMCEEVKFVHIIYRVIIFHIVKYSEIFYLYHVTYIEQTSRQNLISTNITELTNGPIIKKRDWWKWSAISRTK